jgi:hypothetical protein
MVVIATGKLSHMASCEMYLLLRPNKLLQFNITYVQKVSLHLFSWLIM